MQKSQLCVQKEKPEKNPDNPKVVLDTNVLVSAFLSPAGTAAQIVSLVWQGNLQVCYNQEIMDEYEEVLSRPNFKFKIPKNDIEEVVETIKKDGSFFNTQPSIFSMLDETDRVSYDVVKAAGAFLITNNTKHYPKEPVIFTPREFVETFNESLGKTDILLARQYLRRHSG